MKPIFQSSTLLAVVLCGLALFASRFLLSGQTVYVGNSLAPPQDGSGDFTPPLVILGEYNPAGPSASSLITLPPGTIQDVKFYGGIASYYDYLTYYSFTLYVLSYDGVGASTNEQQFRVVSASQPLSGYSYGELEPYLYTVTLSPPLTVQAGDLLAFAGVGPYYDQFPIDAVNSDATYEDSDNPGSDTATPPAGAGTVFTVGAYPDPHANYEYIDGADGNQGRTYAIGVDVLPAPCISIQCPGNIVATTCDVYGGLNVEYPQATCTNNCCTNPVTLVYSPPSGSWFPAGTTNTVQVVGYDSCGNVGECSFTVTVAAGPNTNPPVINHPGNIVVTGFAFAPVFYNVTAASAYCNDSTVICNPPSGSYFFAGTTTVNCVAADCCGNTSTTNFTVTVIPGSHPIMPQTTALSIARQGNQVVLFWPNSTTNWTLQSAPALSPGAWSDVSPLAAVINGTNTVTNAIAETHLFYRLALVTPPGMAPIPAGAFTMGNGLRTNVSGVYMDVNLVSYGQWQSVYNWATNNGYGFDNAGSGKAANHPVQTVDWYDCVKWCNARSQQAGLTPVYYTDTNLTQVYRNGDVTPNTNSTASGYRLPAEAEWEKAARGGLTGQTFPWGDTISEKQANYLGNPGNYSYDVGPNGYNPAFTNSQPYTSPVGYFPPNGYGLYDMAGNVYEWCSDGAMRGGAWDGIANYATCSFACVGALDIGCDDVGFRCVRGF